MNPSTTKRAASSRLPTRASTFGSMNRAPGEVVATVVMSSGGYICDTGTGTTSSSWSMIWSVVMPSDSAWKLSSTR